MAPGVSGSRLKTSARKPTLQTEENPRRTDLGQSPLHGALDEGLFCGPAALGGLPEGLLGRLEELFGFGEAGQVGGQAGDFRD